MKQLIQFSPEFDPTSKTLNFSALPGFDIHKLYAVINVTRNQPIYVPGAPGLGITNNIAGNLTLSFDTTTHSSNDTLNIYYDAKPGYESNNIQEAGGNLEKISKILELLLVETQVTNLLLQGLYSPTQPNMYDYLNQIRDQVMLEGNSETQNF